MYQDEHIELDQKLGKKIEQKDRKLFDMSKSPVQKSKKQKKSDSPVRIRNQNRKRAQPVEINPFESDQIFDKKDEQSNVREDENGFPSFNPKDLFNGGKELLVPNSAVQPKDPFADMKDMPWENKAVVKSAL